MEWKNVSILVFTLFAFMIGNLFGLENAADAERPQKSKQQEAKTIKRSIDVSIQVKTSMNLYLKKIKKFVFINKL